MQQWKLAMWPTPEEEKEKEMGGDCCGRDWDLDQELLEGQGASCL